MKKLLYLLILLLSACSTKNVSKISGEVKVISKCCKELTKSKKPGTILKDGAASPDNNISSILPPFFWDTKSMIR